MEVAIYVRVSTDQQAEKGFSLDTQLAACTKYAQAMGATHILEFIDDGYSGEYIERPALTRLREALLAKEFDVVVVYDPDRLARNLAHQLIITDDIEKSGAQLKFVSVTFEQSPEGKLFYSIRGAISAYEKEKIRERVMRGKRGKLAKGKILSNYNPFGYTFDKNASMYLINDEEAQLIRQMYEWIITEHLGTTRIAQRLNEMGIPSPRAKTSWIVSTVHKILSNPIYKGTHIGLKYYYHTVGIHKKVRTLRPQTDWIYVTVPAIVTVDTWEQVQRQFQLNKARAKRILNQDYILVGLVYCAKCHRKMVIAYGGQKEHPTGYYVCSSQRNNSYLYSDKERCSARRIPINILDDYLFTYLLGMNTDYSVIDEYLKYTKLQQEVSNVSHLLDRITTNERKFVKQQDTILRWFRQQMISDEEADRQLKELGMQLQALAVAKNNYLSEMNTLRVATASSETAAIIKEQFTANQFTSMEKRKAVSEVLETVFVERIDATKARGSRPELNVWLTFL